MVTAVVQTLYGETYAKESILSLEDQVDLIIVLYGTRPWFHVTEVEDWGRGTKLPNPVDSTREIIEGMNHPKVKLYEFNNDTIYRQMYEARHLIPKESSYVIFTNGIDIVQHPNGLTEAIAEMANRNWHVGTLTQRWLWKTPAYELIMTTIPSGSSIFNMEALGWDDEVLSVWFDECRTRDACIHGRGTGHDVAGRLPQYCWDLRCALSDKVLYWKFALRQAQVAAGMSYCDPETRDWYEKWRDWTPQSPIMSPSNHMTERIRSVSIDELPPLLRPYHKELDNDCPV